MLHKNKAWYLYCCLAFMPLYEYCCVSSTKYEVYFMRAFVEAQYKPQNWNFKTSSSWLHRLSVGSDEAEGLLSNDLHVTVKPLNCNSASKAAAAAAVYSR